MSGKSNFKQVRISDDGTELELTGESTNHAEVERIHITYGKAPANTGVVPVGTDLLPREAQHEDESKGDITDPWTISIPLKDEFAHGGAIVIAARAVRKDGSSDVWVGYIETGMGPDTPKLLAGGAGEIEPVIPFPDELARGNP